MVHVLSYWQNLGIDYKGGYIMLKQDMKIGLALSGGGMRAAIFHLGVLKWLAEQGLLKRIHHISSVSGASIAVGLIFANNDNQWPSDVTFLSKVLPAMKRDIITKIFNVINVSNNRILP